MSWNKPSAIGAVTAVAMLAPWPAPPTAVGGLHRRLLRNHAGSLPALWHNCQAPSQEGWRRTRASADRDKGGETTR